MKLTLFPHLRTQINRLRIRVYILYNNFSPQNLI